MTPDASVPPAILPSPNPPTPPSSAAASAALDIDIDIDIDPTSRQWASAHTFPALASDSLSPLHSRLGTSTSKPPAFERDDSARAAPTSSSHASSTAPAPTASQQRRTASQGIQDTHSDPSSVASILRRDRARSWSTQAGAGFTPAGTPPSRPPSPHGCDSLERQQQQQDGASAEEAWYGGPRSDRASEASSSTATAAAAAAATHSHLANGSNRRRVHRSRASSSASIPAADAIDPASHHHHHHHDPSRASTSNGRPAPTRSRPARPHSRGHDAAPPSSGEASQSQRRPGPGRRSTSTATSGSGASETHDLETSRNRSSPHLPALSSLSMTADRSYAPYSRTTPSSPLLSANAALGHAPTSPGAYARLPDGSLTPIDWAYGMQGSLPASPVLSRHGSGFIDPLLSSSAASIHSHHGQYHHLHSHAALSSPSYFPPLSAGPSPHMGPMDPAAVAAAEMAQRAAQLIGLHQLFASRSTPHLPHFDTEMVDAAASAGAGMDEGDAPPPPYAPRASETEQELQRSFAGAPAPITGAPAPITGAPAAPQRPASAMAASSAAAAASSSSGFPGSPDPPLPPPIAIPIPQQRPPRRHSRNALSPGISALSPAGEHRSVPASPSASFHGGLRGLSSISPLPRGLGLAQTAADQAHGFGARSGELSPDAIFAASSSDDDDGQGGDRDGLSFSPSISRERRSERRSAASNEAGRSRGGEAAVAAAPAAAVASSPTLPRPRSSSGVVSRMARQQCSAQSEPAQQGEAPAAGGAFSYAPAGTAGRRSGTRSSGHSRRSSLHLQGRPSVEASIWPQQQQQQFHIRPGLPTVDSDASSAAGASSRDARRSDAGTSDPDMAPRSEPDGDDAGALDQRSLSPTPSDFEQLSRELAGLAEADGGFDALAPGRVRHSQQAYAVSADDEEEIPLVLRVLLHPLRWLAVVPGCLGTFWLARNAYLLATQDDRLYSSYAAVGAAVRQPGALDFAVSSLWSVFTAYYALSFTTLLLRRWLLYYSVLPSLIRLLALQAICWPLVRITVHVFGIRQPLGAWAVIGTTTALSDIVARWVTSNIADAVLEGDVDADDTEDEEGGEAGGSSGGGIGGVGGKGTWDGGRSDEGETADDDDYFIDQFGQARLRPPQWQKYRQRLRRQQAATSDLDVRSGDESDATVVRFGSGGGGGGQRLGKSRRRRKGGQGTRFWRAVIGGPTNRHKQQQQQQRARQDQQAEPSDRPEGGEPGSSSAAGPRDYASGTETEWDGGGESDWPATDVDREGATTTTSALTRHRAEMDRRREFHWDVAMRRNIVPIAALGYLSMWILILDAMRLGRAG
ncbi:uncharacterized protein PFL1_02693 [Pseudozyma flocculosa PF-1]|uniref:Myp1 protein n=1 Tax=Pseudozyma flocculosa PF-1 TaxID=1277687 RepID=A0A061HDD2_9BASI|nr:uncharacterized protein PFL1_02693 [Pseudozyma flocculosa PF-1]EPQ30020.1 hypothetical protein PFL1_02693 [Pseudozyma flocculosa PF-1]